MGDERMSMGTPYPVLFVAYQHGFRNFMGGQYEFDKLEAAIEATVRYRNPMVTRIRVEAGMMTNNIPYGLLFNGQGGYDKIFPVYFDNNFQTAGAYEFLGDSYFNIFISHELGRMFHPGSAFNPMFSIKQAVGFGRLKNRDSHRMLDQIDVMDKGLYESGIQADEMLKSSFSSLGLGVYYRYGPYSFDSMKSNFAVKLSMRIGP
jgi:hypothetical protein